MGRRKIPAASLTCMHPTAQATANSAIALGPNVVADQPGFFVKPIRSSPATAGPQYLAYDPTSGEVTFSTTTPSSSVPNGQFSGDYLEWSTVSSAWTVGGDQVSGDAVAAADVCTAMIALCGWPLDTSPENLTSETTLDSLPHCPPGRAREQRIGLWFKWHRCGRRRCVVYVRV